jgi:hypothetical protein
VTATGILIPLGTMVNMVYLDAGRLRHSPHVLQDDGNPKSGSGPDLPEDEDWHSSTVLEASLISQCSKWIGCLVVRAKCLRHRTEDSAS